MDTISLKSQIESISDLNSIYLIEPLSNSAGFFANDRKLLYIAKDIYEYFSEGIETDYLKLQTHIRISSVKNQQTFKDDFYNIIIFKGDLDDANIKSFIQLCTIHSKNPTDLNFKEFFYSLIALFQPPMEQVFLNAIGLYGELKFMQYIKKNMNIDISTSWHKRSSYSQFDFSNDKSCIEIKTTLSNTSEITIKHQQLFGDHQCTLVIVNCEQIDHGETIAEVISTMYSDPDAFNGINFNINLAKELKRLSINDVKELRFKVKKILFFNTNDINPFPLLPDTVSQFSYKLDFSELTPLSDSELNSIIKQFRNMS